LRQAATGRHFILARWRPVAMCRLAQTLGLIASIIRPMADHPTPVRLTGIRFAINPDGSISHGVYAEGPPPPPRVVSPRPVEEPSTTGSRILDGYLDLNPPGVLYHYTSVDGLIGLLKSRQIWASNVTFLNDAKESVNATEVLTLAFSNRLNRPDLSEQEKNFLGKAKGELGRFSREFYITSLTEERDLLSQWRAYCPPTGGYALGLPAEQLLPIAAEHNFMLAPCIYEYDAQYQISLELIENLLTSYRQFQGNPAVDGSDVAKIINTFALTVARFGLLLKHTAFSEEKEWRLISSMIPIQSALLDFRSVSSRATPFYRLPLASDTNPDLVRIGKNRLVIVIGPSAHTEAHSAGIQLLLFKYAPGGAVTSSQIPYRAW